MKFSVTSAKRRRLFTFVCLVLLGAGTMPAKAINYDNAGTTNYIGWATNDFRLKVGITEPDNTLFITNGGLISVTEVNVGENSTSTSNLLSLTNGGLIIAGNADTNGLATGGIVVGDNNGDGTLSVNHSSEVDTDYLYVGRSTNESGTVTVEGKGLLNIREQLFVGSDVNSNNVVNVKTGGAIYINETTDLMINNIVGASNDFNTVNIESTGKFLVGGDVNATSFTSTSNLNFKSGAILGVGGTLTIDNSAIEDSLNIVLDNSLSTNTAQWNASEIYIGDADGNNSLTLTNGATATASDIVYVGNKAASSGNTLTVSGSNSLFTAQSKVLVGASGDRNALNITDGGQVTVATDLKIGASTGSDNNSLTLSGDGSTLVVSNNVVLGASGVKNRYTNTGGSNTVLGAFIIGETADATGKTGAVDDDRIETTGNLAIIGKDATLDIQQDLTVGLKGGGSILAIRDGGIVNVAGDVIIGDGVKDNYIYLQRDADTRFNVVGDLIVGKEGGSNRFALYGGTANIAGDLYLGATTNQHEIKNFIHVETTNAVLNVANGLYIGASNSINTLDLVDGGTVNVQDLFVGDFEGTSNNVVTVKGEDSVLAITNTLTIGSNTGSNNNVTVQNGGTLEVHQNNIMMGAGTNNTLNIADGGILKTLGWDFAGMTNTATNIVFESGSTLHLLGALSGTNSIDGGLNVVLDGLSSSWLPSSTNAYVGFDTDNNSLTLTNGAKVITTTNLYVGFTSENNSITVAGAGSSLIIGNDFYIGSESNSSAFNTANALEGAGIIVGGDAYLYRGATLKIDSLSQVKVAGDYKQDGFSTLEVGVSTNQIAPNLQVTGKANFEDGATISVYNDGIDADDTNFVQNIVVAGEMTIDDKTATTGLLLDHITITTNLLLDFVVTVTNNNTIVLDNFIVRSIGEAADLEGQLLAVADEINDLKNAGDTNAAAMIKILADMDSATANQTMENYYGEKTSSAPANNIINMGIQSVAEQLTMRADNTRARLDAAANAPAGATGPHQEGQVLQGWLSGYGTWASKGNADGFDGYDATIAGFLIGADFSVAQNILVGIAGGSGTATADKENSATTDTSTIYGSIYSSIGTQAWFADASLIYGGSSIESTMGTTFDTKAEYNAKNVALYFGGGKEIAGKYMIFTPKASLLGNYYKQDAYQEISTTAVGRDVDGTDAFYLQSSLGGSMGFYASMGKVTLKPEIRAFWLHEWNAQEESLGYSLIGGTGNYTMLLQAPEKDIIKLGVGTSARLGEFLELRADLDTRQGSDYSDFTLLGSVRYQF